MKDRVMEDVDVEERKTEMEEGEACTHFCQRQERLALLPLAGTNTDAVCSFHISITSVAEGVIVKPSLLLVCDLSHAAACTPTGFETLPMQVLSLYVSVREGCSMMLHQCVLLQGGI